jgi:hypothetical protein
LILWLLIKIARIKDELTLKGFRVSKFQMLASLVTLKLFTS